MLRFLKVAFLSILLTASLSASDLLLKATNGIISDNDFGIKQLSKDEMSSVKGGYAYNYIQISNNGIGVVALPDYQNEIGVVIGDEEATKNHDYGICGVGVTSCYYNEKTQTHLQKNRNRMIEFVNALGGTYSVYRYGVVYTVSKDIQVDKYGNRYPVFNYGVGAYDRINGSFHKIDSSSILNNNMIIKELRDNFKSEMESILNQVIN